MTCRSGGKKDQRLMRKIALPFCRCSRFEIEAIVDLEFHAGKFLGLYPFLENKDLGLVELYLVFIQLGSITLGIHRDRDDAARPCRPAPDEEGWRITECERYAVAFFESHLREL